ncbi:hypothetical protein EV186_106389 [Labedaea rhizosphaerae]|uniref:Uncharacterized protein n=1 Tax=Labedaea rhizosphaerae TaxID=598644 RepID=A0A4R6S5I9_LABRH|nr:hypothetical protein EV186_106389 [Labedaea rhizosphaerae]
MTGARAGDAKLLRVEYQLTALLVPPPDTAELDPLQRHGVAALLDEQLDMLAGIEGPDGVEIEPLDHRIDVTTTGAHIEWLVEAPALAFAEEGAKHVLDELLAQTELLARWQVQRCEVTASDAALEAAMSDEPPQDEEEDELTEADLEEHLDQLADAGGALRAFEFDDLAEEHAQLLAGALITSAEILVGELFGDIAALEDGDTTVDEHEELAVLPLLPERYRDRYTAHFARQFLITMVIVGYRLTQPAWIPPGTIAESLALHLLRMEAATQLAVHEDLPTEEMLAAFDAVAVHEVSHEHLYKPHPESVDEDDAAADPDLWWD